MKVRVPVRTEIKDESEGTRISECNDKGLETEWSRTALRSFIVHYDRMVVMFKS